MAAQPPPSSSSSRRRAGDKVVGSFSIEDEIGKGSFATVYRGTHKVGRKLIVILFRTCKLCFTLAGLVLL